MPRTTERVMRGCFPPVRRPALPPSSKSAATGTGSSSKPPSLAIVHDDDVLYPPSEAESGEADAARLSTAIASRRFFLASPGRSNSIVDSTPTHRAGQGADDNARSSRHAATSASSSAAKPKRAPPPRRLRYDDIHAVQVMSGSPRADFRESMVEMAAATGLDPRRGAADVAALQELLLCYIAVNEHDALGDIIGAYADLLSLFGGGEDQTAAA